MCWPWIPIRDMWDRRGGGGYIWLVVVVVGTGRKVVSLARK